MDRRTENLMAFLDGSHSVYHAVAGLVRELEGQGYACLQEGEPWKLESGGKYYLTRGGSAVLAFRIPEGKPLGFVMSAGHSDRPSFKIKENGELTGTYTRLATEKYGGMLMHTWMDRPLSVAGRVLVETEQGAQSRLIDIDRDLMMMPNVAIHMNRQANDGYAWNPCKDTVPLLGGPDAKGKFFPMLEEMAGGRILGHDLYCYVRGRATVWGLEEEYLYAPAIDDLECAWGCTQGFLKAAPAASIPVLCIFDSEEVGSGSVQGAASNLLEGTLNRICAGLGLDLSCMAANSFMVSADNGHAVHPNHPEFADPGNAPEINGGIVLKYNAGLRYATDAVSAAVMRKICSRAGVPVQTYCNRADIAGGSTLGHISLGHVSVPTADIGLAQLAMHSAFETAGVRDAIYLEEAMEAYYASALMVDGNGSFRVIPG